MGKEAEMIEQQMVSSKRHIALCTVFIFKFLLSANDVYNVCILSTLEAIPEVILEDILESHQPSNLLLLRRPRLLTTALSGPNTTGEELELSVETRHSYPSLSSFLVANSNTSFYGRLCSNTFLSFSDLLAR